MSIPVHASDPVQIGQKLGKYVLTDKLGEGGMGMVFGGLHEALGRQVAVKLLRGEFARNELVVTRFQQEAEAVSRIGHSNIVAIYDFGHLPDGSLYYVMERIKGLTLTQRMAQQPPLTPQEAVGIFSQICRALHATHTRGIVHRDLKPDNVLLVPQDSGIPHVKVLDFGVAKMRDPDAAAESAKNEGGANLTKVGALLGTPTYMAPEQITSSNTVDGRADLYSLGAMLYEALTGQPPFGRAELMVILTKHVKEAVVPPSQKAQPGVTIPPALDTFVVRTLAKNPEHRPKDPNAFITELEQAWGVSSKVDYSRPGTASVSEVLPAAEAAPASKNKLIAAVAGAVLLVGGGGAAAYFATHKGGATAGPEQVQIVQAPPESPLHIEANKVLSVALAGDAHLRKAAVAALGDVADHASIDQIVTALADSNPEVRRAAASAAIVIGKSDDAALRNALIEAAQGSGGAVAVDLAAARYKTGDDAAEADLTRALQMRDPVARLRASVALAERNKLPAGMLRSAIVAAPESVNPTLRRQAFLRLSQLGDPAFNAELKSAVAGKDPVQRLTAAITLARAKDSAGLVALAAIAQDDPNLVDRVEAAAVQAELGDVGALDTLAAALVSPDAKVRAQAAVSLGRLSPLIPDQSALAKQLSPLLNDGDQNVRIAAAAAVLAVRDTSTPQKRANP